MQTRRALALLLILVRQTELTVTNRDFHDKYEKKSRAARALLTVHLASSQTDALAKKLGSTFDPHRSSPKLTEKLTEAFRIYITSTGLLCMFEGSYRVFHA